jgi:hypothetical protein
VTPYRRHLALAIVVWTIGALPLAAAGYLWIRAFVAPIHHFSEGSSTTVRLDGGDEEAILLQTFGDGVDRAAVRDLDADDLNCEVRGPGGARVRLREIDYGVTRNRDGYAGELGFTAPRDGVYRVSCVPAYALARLALSEELHFWRASLLAFGGLAFCAATIMGGVFIVRRGRRRQPPAAEATTRP